jgi:hypothetical protein
MLRGWPFSGGETRGWWAGSQREKLGCAEASLQGTRVASPPDAVRWGEQPENRFVGFGVIER